MTAPSTLDILRRADQRWATRNADDPAPPDYLKHLAAALEPVADPSAAPAESGEVAQLMAMVAQLRAELEQRRADGDDWKRRAAELDDLLVAARADTRRQVDRAVETYKAKLDKRVSAQYELQIELAAAQRERDAALELHERAAADARADASLQRDADQRVLADATAERDRVRGLLDQLLDAVLGDQDQTGDIEYRTAAAVDLVQRVIEAYTAPAAAVHRHQFAFRGEGKTPGPCTVDGCGKPYPTRKGRVA